jgi:hypothetical protein
MLAQSFGGWVMAAGLIAVAGLIVVEISRSSALAQLIRG